MKTDPGSGFTASAPGGVEVTGPAGVAAPDTDIAITTTTRTLERAPKTLSYLGVSVEIVIGEGVQPNAPITVSVPIPDELDGDTSGVIGYTEHSGEPEFLPVDVADGKLIVTMRHLSWLDFFKVDFSGIADFIGQSVRKMLTGESSDPPDCLEQPIDVDGSTYVARRMKNSSGDDLDGVWPCLHTENGDIVLTLAANGNRAWLARTQPDVGPGGLSAADSNSLAAEGFYKFFTAMGDHQRSTGTLMPGAQLSYTFPSSSPPSRAEVLVDAGLMLTSALVYEISAIYDFTGMSTYDRIEQVPGAWDCFVGAADTFNSRDGNFVDNFASAYSTIVDCMAAVSPGPLSFLLNVLTGGARTVSGLLTSAANELMGNNHGYIQIERSGGGTSVSGDYAQTWTGHTRQMTINPDGSASIKMFSGAANGEEWSARWGSTGEGIDITLTSRESVIGDGLGDLHEGYTWNATMERASDGPEVLHFVEAGQDLSNPDNGFYWCSERNGYSTVCGA